MFTPSVSQDATIVSPAPRLLEFTPPSDAADANVIPNRVAPVATAIRVLRVRVNDITVSLLVGVVICRY